MLSLNVGSNFGEVADWLLAVQRDQRPFAKPWALNDTVVDVKKHIVKKMFPLDFYLKNRRSGDGKCGEYAAHVKSYCQLERRIALKGKLFEWAVRTARR